MTYNDYVLHLHQPFELQFTLSLTMWLQLETIHVVDAFTAEDNGSQGERPFVLSFLGPQQPVLFPQCYWLTHPLLGQVELLLVPVHRVQAGMRYQALVSVPML